MDFNQILQALRAKEERKGNLYRGNGGMPVIRNDPTIGWAGPKDMSFEINRNGVRSRANIYDLRDQANAALEKADVFTGSQFRAARKWTVLGFSEDEHGRPAATMQFYGRQKGGALTKLPRTFTIYQDLFSGTIGRANSNESNLNLFTGSISGERIDEKGQPSTYKATGYNSPGANFLDWLSLNNGTLAFPQTRENKFDLAAQGWGTSTERININRATPQMLTDIGGKIGVPGRIRDRIVPVEGYDAFISQASHWTGNHDLSFDRGGGTIRDINSYTTDVMPHFPDGSSVSDSMKDYRRQSRGSDLLGPLPGVSYPMKQLGTWFEGAGRKSGFDMSFALVDDPLFLAEGSALARNDLGFVQQPVQANINSHRWQDGRRVRLSRDEAMAQAGLAPGDYWGDSQQLLQPGSRFRGAVEGTIPGTNLQMGNHQHAYVNSVEWNQKNDSYQVSAMFGDPAYEAEVKPNPGLKFQLQGVDPKTNFAFQAMHRLFGKYPDFIGAYPQKAGRSANALLERWAGSANRGEISTERTAWAYENAIKSARGKWRRGFIDRAPISPALVEGFRQSMTPEDFEAKFSGGFETDPKSGQLYALNYGFNALMFNQPVSILGRTTSGVHNASMQMLNLIGSNQPAFAQTLLDRAGKGEFKNRNTRLAQTLLMSDDLRQGVTSRPWKTPVQDVSELGLGAIPEGLEGPEIKQLLKAAGKQNKSFVQIGDTVLPGLSDIGAQLKWNQTAGRFDAGAALDQFTALQAGLANQANAPDLARTAYDSLNTEAQMPGFREKMAKWNIPALTGATHSVPFLDPGEAVANARDVEALLARMKIGGREKKRLLKQFARTGVINGVLNMQISDPTGAYPAQTIYSQEAAVKRHPDLASYVVSRQGTIHSALDVAQQSKDNDGDQDATLLSSTDDLNRDNSSLEAALLANGQELQGMIKKSIQGPKKIHGFMNPFSYKKAILSLDEQKTMMRDAAVAKGEMGQSFAPFIEASDEMIKRIAGSPMTFNLDGNALRALVGRAGNAVYQQALDLKRQHSPSTLAIMKSYNAAKHNPSTDSTDLAVQMLHRLATSGLHSEGDPEADRTNYLGDPSKGITGLIGNHAAMLVPMGDLSHIDAVTEALRKNYEELPAGAETLNDTQRNRLHEAMGGEGLNALMLGTNGLGGMSFGAAMLLGAMGSNSRSSSGPGQMDRLGEMMTGIRQGIKTRKGKLSFDEMHNVKSQSFGVRNVLEGLFNFDKGGFVGQGSPLLGSSLNRHEIDNLLYRPEPVSVGTLNRRGLSVLHGLDSFGGNGTGSLRSLLGLNRSDEISATVHRGPASLGGLAGLPGQAFAELDPESVVRDTYASDVVSHVAYTGQRVADSYEVRQRIDPGELDDHLRQGKSYPELFVSDVGVRALHIDDQMSGGERNEYRSLARTVGIPIFAHNRGLEAGYHNLEQSLNSLDDMHRRFRLGQQVYDDEIGSVPVDEDMVDYHRSQVMLNLKKVTSLIGLTEGQGLAGLKRLAQNRMALNRSNFDQVYGQNSAREFDKGGFTGSGQPLEARGVVHAGEYVLSRFDVQDLRDGKAEKVLAKIQSTIGGLGKTGGFATGGGGGPGKKGGRKYWQPQYDALMGFSGADIMMNLDASGRYTTGDKSVFTMPGVMNDVTAKGMARANATPASAWGKGTTAEDWLIDYKNSGVTSGGNFDDDYDAVMNRPGSSESIEAAARLQKMDKGLGMMSASGHGRSYFGRKDSFSKDDREQMGQALAQSQLFNPDAKSVRAIDSQTLKPEDFNKIDASVKAFKLNLDDLKTSVDKASGGHETYIKHVRAMVQTFDAVNEKITKAQEMDAKGQVRAGSGSAQLLSAVGTGAYADMFDPAHVASIQRGRDYLTQYDAQQAIKPVNDRTEQQARLTSMLLRGGSAGSSSRSDPDNKWLYDEGLDMPFGLGPLKGKGALDALGAGMRAANNARQVMWGASHFQYQVLQPMLDSGNAYRSEMIDRGQQVGMYGAGVSFGDLAGGQYGSIMRSQGMQEQRNLEQGRQMTMAYPGLFNAGRSSGALMGAFQAIAGPTLGAAVVGDALGGPVGGAVAGAGAFALTTANYAWQLSHDKEGAVQGLTDIYSRNTLEPGDLVTGFGYLAGKALNPAWGKEVESSASARLAAKAWVGGQRGGSQDNMIRQMMQLDPTLNRTTAIATIYNQGRDVNTTTFGLSDNQSDQAFALQQMLGNSYDPFSALSGKMRDFIGQGLDVAGMVRSGTIARTGYGTDPGALFGTTVGLTSYLDNQAQKGVPVSVASEEWMQSGSRVSQLNPMLRQSGMAPLQEDYFTSVFPHDLMRQDLEQQRLGTLAGAYQMSPTLQGQTGTAYGTQMYNLTQSNPVQAGFYQKGFDESFQRGLAATTNGASYADMGQYATQFADLSAKSPDQARVVASFLGGDRLTQSQNWRSYGGGDMTYNTMDTNTGMGAYYEGIDSGEYGFVKSHDVNRSTGSPLGLFRLSAEEAAGGERQWGANIQLKQEAEQTRQYGLDVAGRNMSYWLQTGSMSQVAGAAVAAGASGFNAGPGLNYQQLEDQSRILQRAQTTFSLQQQSTSLGLQQGQFQLAGQQFQQSYDLQRQSFGINKDYNLASMALSRTQQVASRQWQAEDLSFQRNKSDLSFGWDMQDYDRNIRYARGRDKLDLMRQKSREVISHSMDMGQMDKQDTRLAQQTKWDTDEFNLKKKNFDATNKLQLAQMELEKKHFEENRVYEQKRMEMSQAAFQKEQEWTQTQWALEDRGRTLDRAALTANFEIATKNAAASREAQLYVNKYSDAMKASGDVLGAQITQLDLWTKTLANANAVMRNASGVSTFGGAAGAALKSGSSPVGNAAGAALVGGQNVVGSAVQQAMAQYGNVPVPSAHSPTQGQLTFNAHDLKAFGYSDGGYVPRRSFAEGGYTGNGLKKAIAGVVHAGEYVVPQNGALVLGGNEAVVRLLTQILARLDRMYEKPLVHAQITTNDPSSHGMFSDVYDAAWRR